MWVFETIIQIQMIKMHLAYNNRIKQQKYKLMKQKKPKINHNQLQICPWTSPDDDNYNYSVTYDHKLANFPLKLTSKQQQDIALIEELKQSRIEKFNKTLEQHRERLMRKKLRYSTKSQQNQQLNIGINGQSEKMVKLGQQTHESTSKIHRNKLTQFLCTRTNMNMNYHMSRNTEEQKKEIMKCINPKITNFYAQQKQMYQTLYRPKTVNRNADKFYGSLTKKTEFAYTRYSSSSLLAKQQPITHTHKQSHAHTNSHTNTNTNINHKKKQFRTYSTRPIDSIIEMKTSSYKPFKSVQKLKIEMDRKNKKLKFIHREENHVLDRILIK